VRTKTEILWVIVSIKIRRADPNEQKCLGKEKMHPYSSVLNKPRGAKSHAYLLNSRIWHPEWYVLHEQEQLSVIILDSASGAIKPTASEEWGETWCQNNKPASLTDSVIKVFRDLEGSKFKWDVHLCKLDSQRRHRLQWEQ